MFNTDTEWKSSNEKFLIGLYWIRIRY